jgi:hypothetical protein
MKYQTFVANALPALLCACSAATAASEEPRNSVRQQGHAVLSVPDNPYHRAIFCGQDGTETSAAYSKALARDLRVLAAQGLSAAQSLALIRVQACRPASARSG